MSQEHTHSNLKTPEGVHVITGMSRLASVAPWSTPHSAVAKNGSVALEAITIAQGSCKHTPSRAHTHPHNHVRGTSMWIACEAAAVALAGVWVAPQGGVAVARSLAHTRCGTTSAAF